MPLDHVWCYDVRDRLEAVLPPGAAGDCASPGAGSIIRTFLPNDDLLSTTHSNSLTTNYRYYPHGPVNKIALGTGAPTDPLELTMTFDDLLNVETIDQSTNGLAVSQQTYSYDLAQRLTQAVLPDVSPTPEDYTYDSRGNREVGATYTYDENNRITASLGKGYVHDEDGNLVRNQ